MAEESLWLKLLKQSSTRPISIGSTCVVVGDDEFCQKTVLKELCSIESSNPSINVIGYNYFDVEESLLETTATKVNIWTFNEEYFKLSVELLQSTFDKTNQTIVIALDISRGDAVMPLLQKWLLRITEYIQSYYEQLPSPRQQYLKAYLLHYLSEARINKGTKFSGFDKESSDQIIPKANDSNKIIAEKFALPITIVGCKPSTMNINDASTIKKYRDTIGKIRSVALEIGAGFLVLNENTNSPTFKIYLLHRLYPEQISMELAIEEQAENVFIPAGFDRSPLIQASTNVKMFVNESFVDWLSSSLSHSEDSPISSSQPSNFVEIENEQDWLQGLYSFIQQVAATGDNKTTTLPVVNSSESLSTVNESDSTSTNNATIGANTSSTEASQPQPERKLRSATLSTKTSTVATRRATVRATAATAGAEKADVKDFFTSLLEGNPKK